MKNSTEEVAGKAARQQQQQQNGWQTFSFIILQKSYKDVRNIVHFSSPPNSFLGPPIVIIFSDLNWVCSRLRIVSFLDFLRKTSTSAFILLVLCSFVHSCGCAICKVFYFYPKVIYFLPPLGTPPQCRHISSQNSHQHSRSNGNATQNDVELNDE